MISFLSHRHTGTRPVRFLDAFLECFLDMTPMTPMTPTTSGHSMVQHGAAWRSMVLLILER
jgi:hypothetical protein